MLRFAAPVLILLFFLTSAAAQTPPATTAPAAQTAPQAKPTAKKATAKPKPAESATAGPCGVGVIAGTGDIFVVQKIGLTVFGNDYAEVPVSWGLDDLVFARARAAAGNTPVRRITYAKGALDSYYHPKSGLFRNQREELSNLIRQVAPLLVANAISSSCAAKDSLTGPISRSAASASSAGVSVSSHMHMSSPISA
jgi:hypothetical protein